MTTMQEFVTEWLNSCDAGTPENYSMEDAREDLQNMRADDLELPDDITEETLCEAVNWYIDEYRRLNAE